MSLSPPTVFAPTIHAHLLPQIAALHIACIEQEAICLSLHPPFFPNPHNATELVQYDSKVDARILAFWERIIASVESGEMILWMQLIPSARTDGSKGDPPTLDLVAGIVGLKLDMSDTGPFRADVVKLMVGPDFRRRGIARNLLRTLEEKAREIGRTLLVRHQDCG